MNIESNPLTPRYLLYRALGVLVPYIVGTWGVRECPSKSNSQRSRGGPPSGLAFGPSYSCGAVGGTGASG